MSIVLRKLVERDLQGLRKRRPGFSLRAYARAVATNPTTLSLFLRGKRGLSTETTRLLSARVGLDFGDATDKNAEFETLDFGLYEIVANWHYFAILSLTETRDFRESPKWIAGRLGISVGAARKALADLVAQGMLSRSVDNRLSATRRQFRTTDQVVSASLRQNHAEVLELAQESLTRDPIETRDFSSMTMAIDPKLLPEAREKIQRFRRSLCRWLEAGDKTEVYRLSVQLFPLSRRSSPHVDTP